MLLDWREHWGSTVSDTFAELSSCSRSFLYWGCHNSFLHSDHCPFHSPSDSQQLEKGDEGSNAPQDKLAASVDLAQSLRNY